MEDNTHSQNFPIDNPEDTENESSETAFPPGMTIFPEMLAHTRRLNSDDFRRYIECCLEYTIQGTEPDPDAESFPVLLCFDHAKEYLESQMVKYKKRCAVNRKNGALGGRPRREKTETVFTEDENPSDSFEDENAPNDAPETEEYPAGFPEDENNPIGFLDAEIDENNPAAPNKKQETRNLKQETKNKKQEIRSKKKETQGGARAPRPRDVFAEYAGEDKSLFQALEEFEDMRRQLKKPLTNGAASRLVQKLESFPSEDRIPILQQSVDRCWQDIYELKTKQGGAKDELSNVKPPEYYILGLEPA